MPTLDLRKELKYLYQPSSKEVAVVEVPEMNFLMLDGEGDPNTSAQYQAVVTVLFALSYSLKFIVKKGPLALDYGVMPLEGLWWAEGLSGLTDDRQRWRWTMMMVQPPCITADMVAQAIHEAKAKADAALLAQVRFEPFAEGLCAQIMHIGPFSAEGPTVAKLHAYIAASGHLPTGKHHEIYLTDIRRADPAKWKTVIRQPMR